MWQGTGAFADRVAIVTGSARGVGRAITAALSAGGAQVMINDLDTEAAERTATQIGGDTAVFPGNLTRPGVPDQLVAATVEEWGGLDIVVNNARYTASAPVHRMTDDGFDAMLAIHLTAPFRVLRAAAPHLRSRPGQVSDADRTRKVVNIASMAAYGMPGEANYSAAKAGIIGLTKTLAKEWGPSKVTVNAVAAGFIETRIPEEGEPGTTTEPECRQVLPGAPQDVHQQILNCVPLGRAGRPEEIAGAVAFLCSPWSDYVTGQVLNVSGGLVAGMSS